MFCGALGHRTIIIIKKKKVKHGKSLFQSLIDFPGVRQCYCGVLIEGVDMAACRGVINSVDNSSGQP